jgi:hypothetical protein
MRNRSPVARVLRWLVLPALLLTACTPAAATPTVIVQAPTLAPALVSTTAPTSAPAEPTNTAAEPAATQAEPVPPTEAAPATQAEPTVPPPTVTPFVISDEFTPSDPALVNLAAGQPQLVEFFAFW